jgi:hypothetical protein
MLFIGLSAITFTNATIVAVEPPSTAELEDQVTSCFAADGLCTKLAAAVAAGKGILTAPSSSGNNEHSKRAENYLLTAINDAETGAVTKRSPVPAPIWHLCLFRGSACLKTKRAAVAIEEILTEPLERVKRSADPNVWHLCLFRGSACLKAKRSAEKLLMAARDVNAALSASE